MKKISTIILMMIALSLPAMAQQEQAADSVAVAAVVLPADIAALVSEANEYCASNYLDMELNELEKLKMKLSDKEYKEAMDARDKVSATISLWHEIDGYKRLLYVPFQYDKIGRARERIFEMQDEVSPEQFDALYEKLDSPLSRYFHGVKFFQETLITEFNQSAEQARKDKNISEVRRIFTELLKRPDVKENIENRIQTVPWLQKKFQDYYTYIMNRQSSPRGPVQQEVMKISLTRDS